MASASGIGRPKRRLPRSCAGLAVSYTGDMSIPRLISLVAASLLATVAASAQEAAVMKKSSASVKAPVASMRHVGARTTPVQPVVAAVAASAKTAAVRTARVLPVHFRH
jgi:hypothetical protein